MNRPTRIDPTLLIIAATLLCTVVGAAVGALYGAAFWQEGSRGFMGGLIAGGAACLVVGFVMAWHGSSISRSPGRAVGAAIWGVIPSALIGISVAPVVSGAAGGVFGDLAGGIWLGLLLGPIVGVVAWELAFCGDQITSRILARPGSATR